MRVAVLTSNETRHRYFANAMCRRTDVAAVVYQDTGYDPAATEPETDDPEVRRVLKYHFEERARQEQRFFGHDAEVIGDSPACRVWHIDTETLNTEETAANLRAAAVEIVVVYGTSLIKEPLLSLCPGRTIGMHLGLSPYYRGTATNFYPLLNDEPEYVGVTIHRIDPGIDSGEIIHQGRPDIVADDMPHTVGCKTILVGIELMIRTVREIEAGTVRSTPRWQVPKPRLYLRKDYKPEHVLELYRMIDGGLFRRYAKRKREAERAVQLVE